MNCGAITVDLNRVPVQISVLVEGQRRSGTFVANRERRGIRIANATNAIDVTVDDALLLLDWLQEQAPTLRAMLEEEAAALRSVEPRAVQVEADPQPRPNQAGD